MHRGLFDANRAQWVLVLLAVFGAGVALKGLPRASASSLGQNPGSQREAKIAADPQVEALVARMAAAGVLHPTTVDDARRAYLFYAKLSGPPEHVFHVEDRSVPGRGGAIPIRVYSPRSGTELPIFVFFHGGGFVTGSLDTHDSPLRAVTNRCDCLVVSVAYRLAPEHPYPAATEDAYDATKWVANHAAEIGGDPHRIAVGGDGAGGNLAAVTTIMAHVRAEPHIVYQVLIYPILDARLTTYSWVESPDPVLTNESMVAKWAVYVPVNVDQESPYISPLNAPSFKNLPPALILTDEDEPVRDEIEHYARMLSDAGVRTEIVRYPRTIHGFFMMAGELDAGKKAIIEVAASLRQAFQTGE